MLFETKKAENCFSDAENYEYRIEVLGLLFVERLEPETDDLRINETLRRPTFTATLKNGTRIKGLMDKNVIKAGFTPEHAAEQKATFEQWLAAL
jgi:hypothetical protein